MSKKKNEGRRRASGVNKGQRRFAEIKMPNGRVAKIPAAKDACTYICLVTPDGNWPKKALIVLMYDVMWLVNGSVFEIEEMRAGHGMGTIAALRVISSKNRVQVYDGCYGQVQRWLLCEEVPSDSEVGCFELINLEEGQS